MIRKQRLCHDSLFKSMETKNVIELSAFSKSLSKKITYLNHEERILIDIEQIAAITPSSEREDLPKKNRIAHSNYSNKEIINGTISWSSTSEGNNYWSRLYFSTESKQ